MLTVTHEIMELPFASSILWNVRKRAVEMSEELRGAVLVVTILASVPIGMFWWAFL
jgi:hypothetical protein